MIHSDTICSKYLERVLPNEEGKCSLCNATLEPVHKRLDHIRKEIQKERVSYGEIAELQLLADEIEPGDTILLEWAGVPETN